MCLGLTSVVVMLYLMSELVLFSLFFVSKTVDIAA